MTKLIQGQFDAVRWSEVWIPLVGFVVITITTFWAMTTIPQQRALHVDSKGLDPDQSTAASLTSAVDCDVCVVVHVGDDGSATARKTILPFPLVRHLFHTVNKIQKLAQRDKIICMAVDHPAIPCRMARDALGPDVNCWKFEEMHSQIHTPVRCNHMVVGNTSRYLPQLPTFESQTAGNFTWQQMHVVEFDAITTHTHAPAMHPVRPTVVTGFSENHLSVGLLLLRSIAKATSDARETMPEFTVSVVLWTMDEFRGKDKDDLDCVVREMQATAGVDVEVRRFKFWIFPGWMRLEQTQETGSYNEHGTGEYAWKVIMIHTVLVERGLVLWVDAGDRFTTKEALTESLDYIAEHGFATKTSSGHIRDWTRKEELLYLRATHLNMSSTNCDASVVGLSLKTYDDLARPWYECALTRQCIAPDGSNRHNHRQDQAALTVLMYLSGNTCSGINGSAVRKHMDYHLDDLEGAAKSSCYSDPRN